MAAHVGSSCDRVKKRAILNYKMVLQHSGFHTGRKEVKIKIPQSQSVFFDHIIPIGFLNQEVNKRFLKNYMA